MCARFICFCHGVCGEWSFFGVSGCSWGPVDMGGGGGRGRGASSAGFTPSCFQNHCYAGVPIAVHAHWAEVGGGTIFVAVWEFTGFLFNAPVAQRDFTMEGSVVVG